MQNHKGSFHTKYKSLLRPLNDIGKKTNKRNTHTHSEMTLQQKWSYFYYFGHFLWSNFFLSNSFHGRLSHRDHSGKKIKTDTRRSSVKDRKKRTKGRTN